MTIPNNATAGATGPSEPAELELVEQAVPEGPRSDRGKRRSFTAEFKRRIVAEYDAAPAGTKGAVLRRERLYDSHVKEWRAAIAAGTLGGSKKAGRPPRSREQARIAELERKLAKSEAASARKDEVLADREAALEVLGKGVAFLETLTQQGRSR